MTPTWYRHSKLLDRCVPSVQAQTYPNVEHVVVVDGPDPELAARLNDVDVPEHELVFDQLREHDELARWGHWARLAGLDLAQGDIIAYLDDDNAFRPDHIAKLVAALTASGADFAYSRMLIHVGTYDPIKGPQTWASGEVGAAPPAFCQIDTSILAHRRDLLKLATWEQSLPTIDWDLVERWLAGGAAWEFVPEVTVDYYRD